MKILVTGATGYVGSRVVDQLLAQGHKVVGLCRLENVEGTEALRKKGAEPLIGDVREVGPIVKAAQEADAVCHLAFIMDFRQFAEAVATEKKLITALHQVMKGTNKPLIVTTGTLLMGETKPGQPIDDSMEPPPVEDMYPVIAPRAALDKYCLELAQEGTRICVMRLAPYVYGHNGSGFVPLAILLANKFKYAAYVGDGTAKFTAVHVDDAAKAYVQAITGGKGGQAYHVVSEINTSFKELAEAVGKLVGVEVKSVTKEEAEAYFGSPVMVHFFSINHQTTGSRLAADCGWKPTSKTTITQDTANGSYRADVTGKFK